jgi:hypothetical protein
LARLTARKFQEWQTYDELEPFSELRADYRTASIVSAIMNAFRNSEKRPHPFTVEDARLLFGDDTRVKSPQKQNWKDQKAMIRSFVEAHNRAVLEGKIS